MMVSIFESCCEIKYANYVKRLKTASSNGAWVAQSAEHLILGSSLGHDLMGHGIEPC